jgi:GNAT superfamily N-acetyltransferase
MSRFVGPELLNSGHPINGFDSGEGSLDIWLMRHARPAAGAGSAKTYVVVDEEQEGRVVGYHALTGASVENKDATERAAKGMGQYQISAVLLSRLAVDKSVQKKGLGALLLQDAMRRAVSVSEEVGIRLLLAHALNEKAAAFYARFGFEESPTDPMNVQLIIKDIKASLAAAAASGRGS